MKTKFTILMLSSLLLSVFCFCSSIQKFLGTKSQYQVIIYVKSEKGDFVDPVNISAKVDNKIEIFNQSFKAGFSQVHKEFDITLNEGRHQIFFNSKNGNAGLEVEFEVDKPLWLVLEYHGPNHFQLKIFDSAIAFV